MIQKKTFLIVSNKINIWWVSTIHLFFGFNRKVAKSFNFLKISIKITKLNSLLKKKSKTNAIINLTKKEIQKLDGSILKFKFNSLILLKKKNLPYGKEIFNPTIFFFKRKKFLVFFSFFL
jgi:large subunit ribosomal protein L14